MPSSRRGSWGGWVAVGVVALVVTAGQAAAQDPAPARLEATRAELEAIAAHPPKGMSSSELRAVQLRLTQGDFNVGSRLVIEVPGDSIYSDTFTVRPGRMLQLPYLPPISMEGVLRSESDSLIRGTLSRYLRDPEVFVTPLMRIGVLGGVMRPGYYDVAAATLFSDAVMVAGGGLGPTGSMKKAQVFRGNDEVMDSKEVSVALSSGATLDQLNLQSGDNINVGESNPQNTLNKVQIITAILAIPIMILTITALAD